LENKHVASRPIGVVSISHEGEERNLSVVGVVDRVLEVNFEADICVVVRAHVAATGEGRAPDWRAAEPRPRICTLPNVVAPIVDDGREIIILNLAEAETSVSCLNFNGVVSIIGQGEVVLRSRFV